MRHERDLGKCQYCGGRVISVMGTKEHTIGDVNRNDIIHWKVDQELSAA